MDEAESEISKTHPADHHATRGEQGPHLLILALEEGPTLELDQGGAGGVVGRGLVAAHAVMEECERRVCLPTLPVCLFHLLGGEHGAQERHVQGFGDPLAWPTTAPPAP